MKYTSKKLPDSIIEAEVVLEHKEFLEYYQPIYDQALASVNLKGFRPGAAPKDLAEKAVDKEAVFNEAVNKAVRDSLQEITEENNWQLIDQPKVEIVETNPQENVGLKFKATITIFPEVKLGNYQKIAKKILGSAKKDFSASEEEINQSLQWILNSRAKVTRVAREAKMGDVVDLDFSGFVDGKPLDGASGKADNFVLGEGKFIKGFEENLIGHKEGEHLEFSVNFPADYWKKELQNQKVDFQADLKGVFERELPELTDDFVKSLGKFENAATLKTSIREGIAKEKEMKENERLRLKIFEEIIKNSEIAPPRIMVERTLDNLIAEYKNLVKNPDEKIAVRKNLEEKAKNSVATNLILYQIAKEQKIEPSQEEIESEANKALSHSEFRKNPKIDVQRLYDYIYGELRNKKIFEYLESLK
ncbi:MAG: trigger factor [Candidatus Harrisonbacteria bacterium]|nr:trigger factor [Candidatus Harrisonbacteria bacterium]